MSGDEVDYEDLTGMQLDQSQLDAHPDDAYRQSFAKFLDSEHRVIIETEARLVVGFDTAKFRRFTAQAMAAGQGAE